MREAMRRLWRKVLRLLSGRVDYIGGGQTLPPPFTKEEEEKVMQALRDGDESVREGLIEHNLRLVVYIARKFENTGVGVEDLISIGTIGLIKAVGTFDAGKKIKLATYASRCIENEILMYLRRHSRTRMEVSLDEPLNVDWDGNELLLSDVMGTDPDLVGRELERETDRALLREAISRLTAREQKIMQMRFGLDGCKERTQREVADELGISQSYISRLEKRIIKRLRGGDQRKDVRNVEKIPLHKWNFCLRKRKMCCVIRIRIRRLVKITVPMEAALRRPPTAESRRRRESEWH